MTGTWTRTKRKKERKKTRRRQQRTVVWCVQNSRKICITTVFAVLLYSIGYRLHHLRRWKKQKNKNKFAIFVCQIVCEKRYYFISHCTRCIYVFNVYINSVIHNVSQKKTFETFAISLETKWENNVNGRVTGSHRINLPPHSASSTTYCLIDRLCNAYTQFKL